MAFNANALLTKSIHVVVVAEISSINVSYAVTDDTESAFLLIPSKTGDSLIRIFKRQKSYDQREYTSLLFNTIFRGPQWSDVLNWYFMNNIETLLNEPANNQHEITLNNQSYTICYQGWIYHFENSHLRIIKNNISDAKYMLNKFCHALSQHFSIDFVKIDLLRYKLIHYLPSICPVPNQYSSFIACNPLQTDYFDVFATGVLTFEDTVKLDATSISMELAYDIIIGFSRFYIINEGRLNTICKIIVRLYVESQPAVPSKPSIQSLNVNIQPQVCAFLCKDKPIDKSFLSIFTLLINSR